MKVLLIRLRLIGDVVFTTPAIAALRRHLPAARLSYLVEPPALPVVTGSPDLDEVLVAPRRRGLRRVVDDVGLAVRLRRRRFDLVIDFHGGPRASFLAWASGAPRRIGYARPGRGWMHTIRVLHSPAPQQRHSVENQWDLLRPLGIGPPDRRTDPVRMPADAGAAGAAAARLAELGVRPDTPLILVHASAGNPFRRWPAAAFIELIVRLAATDHRRRILVSSGPSEPQAAHAIVGAARGRLGAGGAAVLLGAEVDLATLRELIARAALFIGGDSGPLHIAATTTTPIVALFGPTLPEHSGPWRDPSLPQALIDGGPLPCRPCDQRRCLPGDFRCLTGIEVESVVAAAERLLRHHDDSLAPNSTPVENSY